MLVMSPTFAPSRSLTAEFAVAAPSVRKALAELWHALTRDLTGSYRPERHYMRGPGPKWHAKHAAVAVTVVNQSNPGFHGSLSAA
jgi:hypothetical protein